VDEVTLAETVQVPLAGIVPPLRVIDEPPAVAVNVPLPQLPLTPLGVATARPVGRPSVNPTPVNPWPESLLVIVYDNVLVPPLGIELGVNELMMDGAVSASAELGTSNMSTVSDVNSSPLCLTKAPFSDLS
jgi:hypothetical protein